MTYIIYQQNSFENKSQKLAKNISPDYQENQMWQIIVELKKIDTI